MLTNVTDFYHKINGSVDGRRVVNVIYLHFNKASDTISHDILVSKWLDGWAYRIVVNEL